MQIKINIVRGLWIATLAVALAGGCSKPEGSGGFSLANIIKPAAPDPAAPPTEYHLDSQPFSPTLPYLFDQARIVVVPEGATPAPPAGEELEPYAFTAIDRFGRCYHFDRLARWWMAEGETVSEPLPAGEWDAAWNPESDALELLITAPWAGVDTIQLLRSREGHWTRLDLEKAPLARTGAARCHVEGENRWIVAGGTRDGQALEEGWTAQGAGWAAWPGEPAGTAPKLAEAQRLLSGPDGASPVLLTRSGAVWIRKGERWMHCGSIKAENLALARWVPNAQKFLFVWSRGLGQDQVLWQTLEQLESASKGEPQILPQTALVRVNDRDEGLWKAWGRARATKDSIGQTIELMNTGFDGTGEAAIQITGPDRDRVIRRSRISTLELPPVMATCRFEAAAHVPALGGLVVPSACGMGMDARREAFFPPEARDAANATTETEQLIDVLQNAGRLWIFKPQSVDFLKPAFEIHPGIDYANAYETVDGRRRCLAWTFPEPGLLRYDFHEFHDKKVQWINSPRLTLKTIEQLHLEAGEDLFLCDPVVWGDPPELVVMGWAGSMGTRLAIEKTEGVLDDEAYTHVPDRGFMARIDALEPSQWKVSTLPIPFCQGAQLVVAPERGSLFLLGGKSFNLVEHQGKMLYFARSLNDVWQWDGENWRTISPQDGIQPRQKTTTHVIYDPATRQLLSLTPRALYGFGESSWRCLWQVPKDAIDYPKDISMYIHPQSRLILGAWFMPRLDLRVWKGTGWVPVRLAVRTEDGATMTTDTERLSIRDSNGLIPAGPDNLVPATRPDAFISVNAAALNAMRMDAPRDRGQDRLAGACWLRVQPANAGPVAYGRGPLGREIPEGAAAPDELTSATQPLLDAEAAPAPTPEVTPTATPPVATPAATPQAGGPGAKEGTETETETGAPKVIEGDDGKTIKKKNHTSLMLRQMESLSDK